MKNSTQSASAAPTVFSFDTHEVRTINRDGGIWFVASDVASALQYRDAHNMTRALDDDERGTQIVSTRSGEQEVTIINESGLYSCILKSRKPEAKRFKKWVTSEVLPTIRKTGSYESPRAKKAPKSLPNGLTKDQQDAVKALVKSRVEVLPPEKRAGAAVRCWSSIKSKFGTTYKEVPAELFTDVVSLIARLPLEGEYLPADGDDAIIIDLDASSAQHDVRILGDAITLDVIHEGYIGGNPVSRLFSLLNMAATQNRPVKVKSVVGAQAIWMAAQEIAWKTRFALRDLERAAESARNSGVKLSMIIPNK